MATSEWVDIARARLDLPDSITDEEIASELDGSFLKARIEFSIACNELAQEYRRLLYPFVHSVAESTSRLFDRNGRMGGGND